MANTINNVNTNAGIFVRAVAEVLEDQCHFFKAATKVDASEFDGKNGFKSGNKLNISIPARKRPIDGFDITSADRDVTEESVSLTLDIKKSLPFDLTSEQLATDVGLEQAIQRFVKPLASDMGQVLEQEYLKRATQATYNLVGTAGSTTYTVADILSMRTKMNKGLAPMDMRHLILESEAGAEAVDARKGLFQSSEEISKQYKKGLIGIADGFVWHESELGYAHTNGTMGGTPLVAGASQSGSTIDIDGLSASGTVTKGTVFTLAGVFAVHPVTKVAYKHLQQFTVTADATASSGAATLSISPAIIATGTTQNVSALPADNAAVTFVGNASTAYSQGLAFHPDAFRVCAVPLELPKGVDMAASYTTKGGMSVAMVRDYDNNLRQFTTRLDFYGGIVGVRPEWACRITA